MPISEVSETGIQIHGQKAILHDKAQRSVNQAIVHETNVMLY